MSNLIKASSINYEEKFKAVDMNARAESAEKKYLDNYYAKNIAIQQIDFHEVSKQLDDGDIIVSPRYDPESTAFKYGIDAVDVNSDSADSVIKIDEELQLRLEAKKQELLEADRQIEDIRKQADQILDDAKAEVTRMMAEAEEQIEAERQEIFEQARRDGYEQGMESASEQIADKERELEQQEQAYKEQYEKQVSELEPAFVEMVVRYVKKLTGIYEKDKKDIILHLITTAFTGKPKCEGYIIRVSEEDYPVASAAINIIRSSLNEDASVEVISDLMLKKNQCMIETESRMFDLSLDQQMSSLIEDILLLAEKE